MKKTFLLLIAFSALAAGLVQPGFGQSQQPEDEVSRQQTKGRKT
jgi:hypothetical protein